MEPRDHARLDDAACGACREPATRERTRLVARRDDLVFLELQCLACASVTLSFVFTDGAAMPEAVRLAGASPVTAADVRDMRQHLAAWQGDLKSLLDRPPAASEPGR
jgi:hypothetical protein